MKRTVVFLMLLLGTNAVFAQGADSLLQGRWILFKVIDNMTGEDFPPAHKTSEEFEYWISFTSNVVKYNLEVNKCENEIIVGKDRSIEFKYFPNCSEVCCDAEFSELLTYTDCTKYFIKEKKTLIMVSEDRIFYFSKDTE